MNSSRPDIEAFRRRGKPPSFVDQFGAPLVRSSPGKKTTQEEQRRHRQRVRREQKVRLKAIGRAFNAYKAKGTPAWDAAWEDIAALLTPHFGGPNVAEPDPIWKTVRYIMITGLDPEIDGAADTMIDQTLAQQALE